MSQPSHISVTHHTELASFRGQMRNSKKPPGQCQTMLTIYHHCFSNGEPSLARCRPLDGKPAAGSRGYRSAAMMMAMLMFMMLLLMMIIIMMIMMMVMMLMMMMVVEKRNIMVMKMMMTMMLDTKSLFDPCKPAIFFSQSTQQCWFGTAPPTQSSWRKSRFWRLNLKALVWSMVFTHPFISYSHTPATIASHRFTNYHC